MVIQIWESGDILPYIMNEEGFAKQIPMTTYLRAKTVYTPNVYMPMTCVLTTNLLILLFTFCSKMVLTLFSILSWKRFRIQLEKRGNQVRTHFMIG